MASKIVGAEVQKLFHGWGWYHGVVTDTLEHGGRRYYRVCGQQRDFPSHRPCAVQVRDASGDNRGSCVLNSPQVEYEDGDAEDITLAELRKVCNSPVLAGPGACSGDTQGGSEARNLPNSSDGAPSDDGTEPQVKGTKAGDGQEDNGWARGLPVARAWGERNCLPLTNQAEAPSQPPATFLPQEKRGLARSTSKKSEQAPDIADQRHNSARGRGPARGKRNPMSRKRGRAVNYDAVPRKKRSDLGVAMIRLSPGFSIRKLPQMFKEFQMSRSTESATVGQPLNRPRRLSEDCSTEGSVKHSWSAKPKAPAPEQSSFSPHESTTRTSPSPRQPRKSPRQPGRDIPPWREAVDDSARLAGAAGAPCASTLAKNRAGTQGRSRGQQRAGRRRGQQASRSKRPARPDTGRHWLTDFAKLGASKLSGGAAEDVIFRSVPERRPLGEGQGAKRRGFDSCMDHTASAVWASAMGKARNAEELSPKEEPKPKSPPNVINALMTASLLNLGDKLEYRDAQGTVVVEGWVTWNGILCIKCAQVDSLNAFKGCAGSPEGKPMESIFLTSGYSLGDLVTRLSPEDQADIKAAEEGASSPAPVEPSPAVARPSVT